MQKYTKTDENGMTHILSDEVFVKGNPANGEPDRTYIQGTPEYEAYALQNGFTLTGTVDNSLPSASEIDAMTGRERDEVLKKIIKRI